LLGILSGLIFPSSRPEDQVLGGARTRVRQKAHEFKEEAKESAQRVVEETKRAAEEEAERHGLTPS
jgi:gas vesicle protein